VCNGSGACEPSDVTKDQSVIAGFTPSSYVTASFAQLPDGGDGLCDPNPGLYGETRLCDRMPSAGVIFLGWLGDCS
jgi:hypothetical protein